MSLRTVLSVVGVSVAVVGFAIVAVPGAAAGLSTSETVLVVVAAVALLQGLRVGSSRLKTPYQQTETPDPEGSQELPTPGDEFDELLREAGRDRRARESRAAVSERLERAAVAAIARAEGCSTDEAIRRLDAGTWTDDPYAAAFFTGELRTDSLLSRLDLLGESRSQFHRWATHAAREIARLSEETT
ncbi:DUF7269 family protein [Haloarchaeobius sp. TZWWS8]|uniref:DUF7269 family protein n=1 Tax=Haloarchaeobius sp. TZWWS8 TaxID=3446121 RepID=UPI003EC05017